MHSAEPLAVSRNGPANEAISMSGLYADATQSLAETVLLENTNHVPTKVRRMFVLTIFALSTAFGAGAPATADQPPHNRGEVIVEKVWATPAKEGGQSILRLRIINESRNHAHFIGVETPVAKNARIVGRVSDHKATTFESMSVRADGELDLTTDHMWIELGPLARSIKPGDSIPVELVFLRSRIRTEAHVHGADG